MLAWLAVLLLSFGLNLYLLLGRPPAAPAPPPASPTRLVSNPANDDDDDTNEEDDASWVALSEELRETRRELADCRGHRASAANHQAVSQ
ncbi:hypothetical protein [Hymenobacter cellulosilyticus]|uniref:Uncharacterized protein n=1 Tax=Hymenobacter cellulosilyticus TaxID=2932248 RepID=A0A8T9Q807_9BACT|nr:hypothetical protein [Hymenobacter cellulosilyticus]UOQ73072.1 hypothetical protein MUN79_03600 [Hymenobacter cellulosilyticus]